MPDSRTLLYVLRRDLRVADNPILHHLATKNDEHNFTQLLPLYVIPAQQVEVSGFLKDAEAQSPYPEARSQVGKFWRCGPHRAKFLAESVDDLKKGLDQVGSGLCVRVGMLGEVVKDILDRTVSSNSKISAVWMVGEEGQEEAQEEEEIKDVCDELDIEFKLWTDEKYLVDDRDLPFDNIKDFPDVFTSYRKMVEPLREIPREVLPAPAKGALPPLPSDVPPEAGPFTIPDDVDRLIECLQKPLNAEPLVDNAPVFPPETESAHPFKGGETQAIQRLSHLIESGSISNYHSSRNGLLGLDYSTKLSAYLALGSITARKIHSYLLELEDGTNSAYEKAEGYGKGENAGTKAVRFELLWRDYMRLCTRKYGLRLFRIKGFKGKEQTWHSPAYPPRGESVADVTGKITRFLNGTTGMGLIDAAMRELYLTGYHSNRARQNVASFFAKMLKLDWRIGAEWFECMLIDYDLSSNWGNWQYVAGVGNDPRGEARVFNPVKQAFDYDSDGAFVRAWCPEARNDGLELGEIFQGWTVKESRREEVGLKGLIGVEEPLVRIEFTVGKRGGRYRGSGRGDGGNSRGGNGHDRGGRHSRHNNNNSNSGRGGGRGGNYGGRGYGSTGRAQYGTYRGGGGRGGYDAGYYGQQHGPPPNGHYGMHYQQQQMHHQMPNMPMHNMHQNYGGGPYHGGIPGQGQE